MSPQTICKESPQLISIVTSSMLILSAERSLKFVRWPSPVDYAITVQEDLVVNRNYYPCEFYTYAHYFQGSLVLLHSTEIEMLQLRDSVISNSGRLKKSFTIHCYKWALVSCVLRSLRSPVFIRRLNEPYVNDSTILLLTAPDWDHDRFHWNCCTW